MLVTPRKDMSELTSEQNVWTAPRTLADFREWILFSVLQALAVTLKHVRTRFTDVKRYISRKRELQQAERQAVSSWKWFEFVGRLKFVSLCCSLSELQARTWICQTAGAPDQREIWTCEHTSYYNTALSRSNNDHHRLTEHTLVCPCITESGRIVKY